MRARTHFALSLTRAPLLLCGDTTPFCQDGGQEGPAQVASRTPFKLQTLGNVILGKSVIQHVSAWKELWSSESVPEVVGLFQHVPSGQDGGKDGVHRHLPYFTHF